MPGAQWRKEGDFSKFVEEAVRWRLFDQTVQAIRARNRDLPPKALELEIDRAVQEVRAKIGGDSV